MFVSSVFLFDFGWFREQFCIIACPYGRIQSVMMDQNSLVVAYDTKRGEPRRAKDVPKDQQGDCVNCFACVRSCPTGIDIRRGTQLECIACTNCIDACDDIMTKLKKNTGLIRYDTENGLNGQPSKKLKTRSVIYLTIIAIIVATFIVVLQRSYDLKTQFVRGKQVFVEIKLDDGVAGVLNQYKLTFDYKAEDKPEIMMRVKTFIKNQVELVTPKNPYSVMIGHQSVNVFFKFRKDLLVNGNLKIVVEFVNTRQPNIVLNEQEVNLVGPVQ
jgi:cytochrome c oxidase accessory protein FixG